jgi:PAS domain S-box-containing protein
MLTVRTNAALGRLASLQKRAARATEATAPVIRPALKELSDALEELRVANEQLQRQVDELLDSREQTQTAVERYRELVACFPAAALWTDQRGQIQQTNPAAASLFNVSALHLIGREMVLFLGERQKFLEALQALNEQLTAVVELPITVRPRERRARVMRLHGRRLAHDERMIWYLIASDGEAPPDSAL